MTFIRCIALIWLVQVMYDAKIDRWYWEATENGTLVGMSVGNFATEEQAEISAGHFRKAIRLGVDYDRGIRQDSSMAHCHCRQYSGR